MLCVMLGALFFASRYRTFTLQPNDAQWSSYSDLFCLAHGMASAHWTTGQDRPDREPKAAFEFRCVPAQCSPGWYWIPSGSWYSSTTLSESASHHSLIFPLYLPFVLIALPTGFLFYRDRKARPGLCAICRYNLRGLPETTMKCPECGSLRRAVQEDLRSAVQGQSASVPATPPAEEEERSGRSASGSGSIGKQ